MDWTKLDEAAETEEERAALRSMGLGMKTLAPGQVVPSAVGPGDRLKQGTERLLRELEGELPIGEEDE